MQYLLRNREAVCRELEKRHVYLFLDFDGTLSPIANTPDKAVIPLANKIAISELSQTPRCKVAIVSGRAIADLKTRVGVPSVIYVGNHGLEIEGSSLRYKPPMPARYRSMLTKIKDLLEKKCKDFPGVLVEDKGFSLSLHYRLARPEDVPKIKTLFHETMIFFVLNHKFMIKEGKKVLEVRHKEGWDKGKVVLWLLARWTFALKGKAPLPVYIGDDVTDEDAFRALKNNGITIVVGKTKDSLAKYYLKDYTEVTALLEMIAGEV